MSNECHDFLDLMIMKKDKFGRYVVSCNLEDLSTKIDSTFIIEKMVEGVYFLFRRDVVKAGGRVCERETPISIGGLPDEEYILEIAKEYAKELKFQLIQYTKLRVRV